jgi:hypothetical protein
VSSAIAAATFSKVIVVEEHDEFTPSVVERRIGGRRDAAIVLAEDDLDALVEVGKVAELVLELRVVRRVVGKHQLKSPITLCEHGGHTPVQGPGRWSVNRDHNAEFRA